MASTVKASVKKALANQYLKDGSNALPDDFNEQLYLQARPDVAQAVKDGKLKSGAEHYVVQGFQEDNSGYDGLLSNSIEQGYKDKATSLYDTTYNTNVTNVKNEAATALQNADNQLGSININYDKQSASAQQQTNLSKNNLAKNTLSRGLGRSTIATSGLAGLDASGDKIQAGIEQSRTNDLNNIENIKTTIKNNLTSKLSAMESDRASGIAAKIQELKDKDYQNSITEAGLTGMFNGQQTIQGKSAEASITGQNLANQTAQTTLQYLPQQLQAQIQGMDLNNAYQTLVNAGYSEQQAAQIAQINAQTANTQANTAAQNIQNQYLPAQLQKQIEGMDLQNAYQTLVNQGYPQQQAAQLASVYANIRQGDAQIAISQQNANTSAKSAAASAVNAANSLAWAKDPNNPDNQYKVAQIEATKGNGKKEVTSFVSSVMGKTDSNGNPIYSNDQIRNYILYSDLSDTEKAQLLNQYGL